MNLAPSTAFSTVSTFSVINFFAISSKLPVVGKDIIILASGSKPFLIASVAFVFFFSLYGRYKSSTSTNF